MRPVRARDAADEVEVIRRLDRLSDGAPRPTGDPGDAHADDGHAGRIGG
jgi:hypothetical protein